MKRTATLVAAALLLVSAITAYAAVAQHGQTKTKEARTFGITVRTSARLYPGVRVRVMFAIRNRNSFVLTLKSLKVTVASPSRVCRSTALIVGRYRGTRKLRARGATQLWLPIQMAKRAPNACKGASFKLMVKGKASKATRSRSRTHGARVPG